MYTPLHLINLELYSFSTNLYNIIVIEALSIIKNPVDTLKKLVSQAVQKDETSSTFLEKDRIDELDFDPILGPSSLSLFEKSLINKDTLKP